MNRRIKIACGKEKRTEDTGNEGQNSVGNSFKQTEDAGMSCVFFAKVFAKLWIVCINFILKPSAGDVLWSIARSAM
jgi:hypothetical protein